MPRKGKMSARSLRKKRKQIYQQAKSKKSNGTADLQPARIVDTDPEYTADLLVTEDHMRNRILHGSFNQADASLGESAGKQCTCTSLAFTLEAMIRPNLQVWTSEDLDEIVRHGTDIYDHIPDKRGDYLLIDELPTSVSHKDDTFVLTRYEPFCGTIGRQVTEGPFYSVLDALTETFRTTSQAFLTIGIYTSGMVCSSVQNQGYFLFDSHSRDHAGYQCANGTSVCMQFMTVQEIAQYIGQLAQSMNDADPQTPFEITPVDVLVEQTELSIHTHNSRQPVNISAVLDKTIAPQRIDGASCSHWSNEADRAHSKKDTVAPTPAMHNETIPDQSIYSPSYRERKSTREKDLYWSNELFRRKKIEASRLRFQASPECAETNRVRARVRKHTHSQTLSDHMQGKRATNPTFRDKENLSRRKSYQLRKNVRGKRQAAAKAAKVRAKAKKSNIEKAIDDFKAKCTEGPCYTCCVCNHLLFKSQVAKCQPQNYTRNKHVIDRCIRTELLHVCTNYCDSDCKLTKGPNANLWICSTCNNYLEKGQMPQLAVANGLATEPQPEELAELNSLEQQLIAVRLPFMKLANLPSGKQKGIRGPVVMVPANVAKTVSALPRMLSDSQLVPVKLKRKLEYRGHVAYRKINIRKVNDALAYLKQNNPLYKDIAINDAWQETDDENLLQLQRDIVGDSADISQTNTTEQGHAVDVMDENEQLHTGDHRTPACLDAEHLPVLNADHPKEAQSNTANEAGGFDEHDELHGVAHDSCVQPLDMHTHARAEMQNAIVSVAPAEHNKPVSIFLSDKAEAQTFPSLFPTGKYTFDEEREKKVSRSRYYNARLLSADLRFAQNTEYIFHAQFATELEKLQSGISVQLRKGSPRTNDGATITAGMLNNRDQLGQLLKSDQAFAYMRSMRGTPEYWGATLRDLFAMVRTLGIPTWFLSFSSAELRRWPETVETIAAQNGHYVDFHDTSYEERCEWIRSNPVTSVRIFDNKVRLLMSELIKSSANPIGVVTDYFYRVEFQKRGAPHIHVLLWIEGAPLFDTDSDSDITAFIDRYISCRLPGKDTDRELHEIVDSVQMHAKGHKKSCKSATKACRFNFPKPVAKETRIIRPQTEELPVVENEDGLQQGPVENQAGLKKLAKERLSKLSELLSTDEHTSMTVTEIVMEAGFSDYDCFLEALSLLSSKASIVMAREPKDVWVNNYNPNLLKAWNANLDIQYVLDPYSCIMYILSYISKSEHELGELLRTAQRELWEADRTTDLKKQMRKLGSVYFDHREVSVQEAVVRTVGLSLKDCSRKTEFLATDNNSTRMSKSLVQIQKEAREDQESANIWLTSKYERYLARPRAKIFTTMCQASFFSDFRVVPKSEAQATQKSKGEKLYKLHNDLGYVRKRTRTQPAVIRYAKYSQTRDAERYFQSQLKLFLPHRTEAQLKPTSYDTFEDFYNTGSVRVTAGSKVQPVKVIVERNRAKFDKGSKELQHAWDQLQTHGHLEDAWSNIAPQSEQLRLEDTAEISHDPVEQLDNTDAIPELTDPVETTVPRLCTVELLGDSTRNLLHSLNNEQRELLYFVRNWCMQTVHGERPDPFYVHVNGGAGVGKSHVIKCIYNEANKVLRNGTSPDDTTVLLASPTGTAAFNIGGHTIHSVLKIPRQGKYRPLTDDTLNTLQAQLHSLKILIIDEISMVDRRVLSYISGRLRQIKQVRSSEPSAQFGYVSVLAVGDFYQLPPVRAASLMRPDASQGIDLWHDYFKVFTLTEIMRQREDAAFACLLNRLRQKAKNGDLLPDDDAALRARCDLEAVPEDALHVFSKNIFVDQHNETMLARHCEDIKIIDAEDFKKGLTTGACDPTACTTTSGADDLAKQLQLAINARVMLLRNIDVTDGLVNGAFGTVVGFDEHLVTATDQRGSHRRVTAVYVQFDSDRVGRKQPSHSKNDISRTAVCIKRYDENMASRRDKTRRQFPLKLAWACTVHKTQGMTTDRCVFDMTGVFAVGQAYVALSRATNISGLYIRNYNPDLIFRNELTHEYLHKMHKLDLQQDIRPTGAYMDICYQNIQGVLSKLKDIAANHSRCPCEVLLLCETWLNVNTSVSYPFLPKVMRQDRADMSCRGGVAVLHTDRVNVKRCDTQVPQDTFEHLAFELQLQPSEVFLVVTVYRRPTPVTSRVTDALMNLLSFAHHYSNILFVGDFNENLKSECNHRICTLFQDHGYTQLVTEVTTTYGSILDHVYIKSTHSASAKVVQTYYSDHELVRIRILGLQAE